MARDLFLLEGTLSIQSAIEAGQREIHDILIDENKRYDQRLSALRRLAESAGIEVSFVAQDAIDQLTSGGSHGGVVARAGARSFVSMAQLLPTERAAFIVMLDGVEDPYNFAGAIRALYAAGADGVVLRQRNWTTASAIVGRASAGTIERMPLAIAESAADAADFYKRQGLRIAAAGKTQGSRYLYQADLITPLFLLIGGERRGVTRSFLQRADLKLEIPYGRQFSQSLGTVGAASVIAFEVMRQRNMAAR